MHELSLAEGVLQIVRDAARSQNFRRVIAVRLEIGALAAVEIEALRFGFAAVVPGSIAEHARLEIEQIPGRAWCLDCCAEVPLTALYAPCPQCGGYKLQALAGTEMRVKDLEVE